MVLAELISQYLKSNRRLVVPQLGAFLVKEPAHKIFFSTFLKRDDGVLRELLISSGISQVESEALLNRLLFEIRYAVENREVYSLVGVGNFSGDENGAITFSEWVGQEELPQDEQDVEKETASEQNTADEEHIEIKESQDAENQIETVAKLTASNDNASDTTIDLEQEEAQSILKPSATTKAYQVTTPSRDDEAKTEGYVASASARKPYTSKKKQPDIWLLLAIAVVLLAIGAIMYGYFVDSSTGDNSSDDYAVIPTTQTLA